MIRWKQEIRGSPAYTMAMAFVAERRRAQSPIVGDGNSI